MAEQIELNVARRTVFGKQVVKLRRQGVVPANIYGHGLDSTAVQADERELRQVIRRAGVNTLVTLNMAGEAAVPVFVREVEIHPTSDRMLHVEFYQVNMSEKVSVEVPVHMVGTSPAVEMYGAMPLLSMTHLNVECLPAAVPHSIQVDISELRSIGDAVLVGDLRLPDGVEAHNGPEETVVRLVGQQGEEAAAAGEAPTEVEVVGRKKAEEVEE